METKLIDWCNMATKVIRIDVFISSPSDVAIERDIVRRVIETLNRSILRDYFFLVPMLYEEDVPPQVGQDAQLIVDRFMQVQRSQVMVCMLWSRMGTPFEIADTGEQFDSGTQYEFIKGYESFAQNGYPNILLYRRTPANSQADTVQLNRVETFFNSFQGARARWKGLWAEYDDLRKFEEKVRNDLERVIQGLRLEEQTSQWINPPEFQEEARRLDAAMPKVAVLGEPTEVRAMVCLPNSPGLAAFLPESTDEISVGQEDVREGNLMIAFPKDPISGELQSTTLTIKIESEDFHIREPQHKVILSPGQDSATVSILLTPNQAREKSLVVVRVKGRSLDGGEYLCGSTVLRTAIQATTFQQIASTAWRLASFSFGAATGWSEMKSDAGEESLSRRDTAVERVKAAAERAKDLMKACDSQSGFGGFNRSARAARWVMSFDTGGGIDTLLVQVGLLGGEIAYLQNDSWWLVSGIHTDAPESVSFDLSQETREFWVYEEPEFLSAVANRLGLVEPPQTVVALLSEDVEQRLLKMELEYYGADESDIRQTAFRVHSFRDTVRIMVESQQLR